MISRRAGAFTGLPVLEHPNVVEGISSGSRPFRPAVPDEYLTTGDVAKRLKWAPKTVENKVRAGEFTEGVHFFRRPGMRPRWKWEAVVEWLENRDAKQATLDGVIKLATSSRRGVR